MLPQTNISSSPSNDKVKEITIHIRVYTNLQLYTNTKFEKPAFELMFIF